MAACDLLQPQLLVNRNGETLVNLLKNVLGVGRSLTAHVPEPEHVALKLRELVEMWLRVSSVVSQKENFVSVESLGVWEHGVKNFPDILPLDSTGLS